MSVWPSITGLLSLQDFKCHLIEWHRFQLHFKYTAPAKRGGFIRYIFHLQKRWTAMSSRQRDKISVTAAFNQAERRTALLPYHILSFLPGVLVQFRQEKRNINKMWRKRQTTDIKGMELLGQHPNCRHPQKHLLALLQSQQGVRQPLNTHQNTPQRQKACHAQRTWTGTHREDEIPDSPLG